MDMITKMELEDAVKNQIWVNERVLEVAIKVGLLTGEIDESKDDEHWSLDSWHADLRDEYPEEREYLRNVQVHVRISCKYFSSSEDRDDDYEDISTRLYRMAQFPYRYLIEPDETWEEEVAKQGRNRKRRLARMHLEGYDEIIEEAEARVKELVDKKAELKALAEEPDE